jgi:ribosome-binding protein aMBF1 (putative translation factor)
MLTPAQLRAARALLDWSQDTLAEKSGTSIEDVRDFESVGSKPKRGMRRRWERALSQGGVEFIDDGDASLGGGPGVRLREKMR